MNATELLSELAFFQGLPAEVMQRLGDASQVVVFDPIRQLSASTTSPTASTSCSAAASHSRCESKALMIFSLAPLRGRGRLWAGQRFGLRTDIPPPSGLSSQAPSCAFRDRPLRLRSAPIRLWDTSCCAGWLRQSPTDSTVRPHMSLHERQVRRAPFPATRQRATRDANWPVRSTC